MGDGRRETGDGRRCNSARGFISMKRKLLSMFEQIYLRVLSYVF